ncbi:MAG TPA: hypothetical protein VFA50_09285 [Stellaceae bacterium]|nr:hypothetical protein [Stellaceae bacterium]
MSSLAKKQSNGFDLERAVEENEVLDLGKIGVVIGGGNGARRPAAAAPRDLAPRPQRALVLYRGDAAPSASRDLPLPAPWPSTAVPLPQEAAAARDALRPRRGVFALFHQLFHRPRQLTPFQRCLAVHMALARPRGGMT